MALDIGYVSAVGAGAISFLSPCVLPLVPPYLCYMAGVSVDDFRGNAGVTAKADARSALLYASIAFVLGFSTVFVALGAGASTIGRLLRVWQEPLAMAAGVLIILMGLNFLGIVRIPLLSREARFQSRGKPASIVAAYVMGLAFAFGWTPCIGPVLGPILTLAGGRETVGEGALLLAAYSLGLGIPFLLAALFTDGLARRLKAMRRAGRMLQFAAGGIMVAMGLAMITGQLSVFSFWLLENFPIFTRIG
ncbi:MAG: cytochrome c biogenesis protein CcdA [Mesorhizobium sp.]|nr:MAG: cytochrome c biogenesis protein CcdA [Mesorhizobium sp.]